MDRPRKLNHRRNLNRSWEDMEQNCLAQVFIRVGLESLLLFIPFVCKSWYSATKNPACWERINFPDANDDVTDPFSVNDAVLDRPWTRANRTENQRFDVFIRTFARENDILWRYFSITNFMKMVIDRSAGSLRFLKIPGLLSHYMFAIHKTLQHVGKSCKNFAGLQLTNAAIGRSEAEAIVTFVPNLSFLSLRRSQIPRELMVMLLKGMKNLVLLDVRECVGFDQQDEEILRLASEIPTFLCRGARICAQEHLLRMSDGSLVHVIAVD
ncbi:hypothetical protein C1H46_030959 [Malus baccata]|uniref:F-box domain-containing protein n=1 Tax=Malus baccata TaxID=106549 RepID=A0A540LAW5_MALBA|nr:hypothetical protein C1H46_030959 [Malus baccata]